MEPQAPSPHEPAAPEARAPALSGTGYIVGGVVLILFAAVVLFLGDRLRWGTAKGITLAVVGLGQLAVAQTLRAAARAEAPAEVAARRAVLARARIVAWLAWGVWIAVWVAERVTR